MRLEVGFAGGVRGVGEDPGLPASPTVHLAARGLRTT